MFDISNIKGDFMKFCPNCGEKLDNDNFKFCPECGYKFGADTNNSNKEKSGGFISSFIKGIRDEIPDDYVDKIKDNETIDDAITHAKIIWHGPQSEKEKAYKERKRKEKEEKDPIKYKISEVTGKHLSESQYFTERKKLFNVSDGYTYYKDILKWEADNYDLKYDDIEARLDELLKIHSPQTIFELRFKHPTCLFKTREDLKNYIGHGTARAPIPFTDEEIEKRKRDLDFAATLKNIQSKETDKKDANKIINTKPVDNNINQEIEKPKVISATTTSKKENLTNQKTDEPNYADFGLSELEESLIKSLPLIDNPSEYEENIITKYAEYNSAERKELLKDCWTITKLAEEHGINRKEVQNTILTEEFLEKDLIGVFKVNPNNIRSLKILYRKPLVEEQQKQEIENLSTNEEIIEEVNEIPVEESNDEKIEEVNEIPVEESNDEKIEEKEEIQIKEQINESIEQPVETSKEENIITSNNVSQDNKKDNNKKKEKKGIGRKIMDFNLGKSIADKGKAIVEEEKREVIEKISPLLPEYAKMLNTTPDNLYVTYTADTYMFRGTKHTSMDKNGVVMSIEDTKISYIVFGKIVGNRRTFFDTVDIYSISFKNITSISDKVLNIELKMSGDNSINIMSEDYFGKRFLSELLEKYNNFNNDSEVTDNNASHNDTSNADELLKYAELYKQGLLSEEEFEAKKKELL